MFHADLKNKLEAVAGCNAYPVVIPDNATHSSICYTVTNTVPDPTAESSLGAPSKNVTLIIVAKTYDDLQGLADAIYTALSGFSGTMGDTEVILSKPVSDRDEVFDPDYRVYGRTLEFQIIYSA